MKNANLTTTRVWSIILYSINIFMWLYLPLPSSVFPFIAPSWPSSFLEPVEPVQVGKENFLIWILGRREWGKEQQYSCGQRFFFFFKEQDWKNCQVGWVSWERCQTTKSWTNKQQTEKPPVRQPPTWLAPPLSLQDTQLTLNSPSLTSLKLE